MGTEQHSLQSGKKDKKQPAELLRQQQISRGPAEDVSLSPIFQNKPVSGLHRAGISRAGFLQRFFRRFCVANAGCPGWRLVRSCSAGAPTDGAKKVPQDRAAHLLFRSCAQ